MGTLPSGNVSDMFYVKKLVAFVLPPFGPILVAFAGLWIARKHPRLGCGLVVLALLSLAALSQPMIANALLRSLETYPPISARELAQAQAIVVLGGGKYFAAPEYGGDTVNRWTLERIRYAVRLQRQSGLPILVTGGAVYGGRPEAAVMQEAIEQDFHGRVKWSENASRDTAENAAFSAGLLRQAGVRRIALVSHGWHLRRAVELFERQELEVYAAPTAFTTEQSSLFARALPSASSLERSSEALHEWLGIFVQRVLHVATD